jgi:hypothetical protein
MLDNLRIDTSSLVYDLLKSYAVEQFWDFKHCVPVPGSTYLIGRQQFIENQNQICQMAASEDYTIIFDNAAEGSWALQQQIKFIGIDDLVLSGNILVIGGGDMPSDYPYIRYDYFINVFLKYEHNLQQMARLDELYNQPDKPYKFLFLNGATRTHRKYLWQRFRQLGLLDQALWTMLDSRPARWGEMKLIENGVDLFSEITPIQHLPSKYEYSQYRDTELTVDPSKPKFVKHDLFKNTWGEVYLQAEPYRDTYFSVVTETVFGESSHSFRTEKIVKPLAMGHPWIAVANAGYYRDLQNLGFRTFSHVIDESFDQIDSPMARAERIITIVKDLCQQDLASFLDSCYNVCKYNQQHLMELREQIRSEFSVRFWQFLQQHQ